MGYLDEVQRVVSANAEEIRQDLDQAMDALRRSRAATQVLENEVAGLEQLLAYSSPVPSAESRGRTLHDAMEIVIRESPVGMLRAGDIAFEINRRGLYRMRDGRPVEAQQIHARVGNYDHLFAREGTFIKMAKQND